MRWGGRNGIMHEILVNIQQCKAKRQYLLTLQVSRCCLLALQTQSSSHLESAKNTKRHSEGAVWLGRRILWHGRTALFEHMWPANKAQSANAVLMLGPNINTALAILVILTRHWPNAVLMLAEWFSRPVSQHDWHNYDHIIWFATTYMRFSITKQKLLHLYQSRVILANTRHWINVRSMLARRLRRRSNIDPTLFQCLVFAGMWMCVNNSSSESNA